MGNGSFNPICALSQPVYCSMALDSDLEEIELFVETGT